LGRASVCFTIIHPNVDELEILLKAPDGTTVPLSIQNGGTGNNYTNTCFTATAATSIKFGSAPFTGSFIPEGYLGSVNNGQNANGVWSICIQDRRNGGNSGSLSNSWSLTFNNTPAPLPPAITTCSTTLPATSSCATATAICDFNGLCGSTSGSSVQDWTNSGLNGCFGLQNNSFIKFIASASTASFTVWVPTNTGGTGGGIQMLFFSGTCNSGPVTTHGCYPHIFPYQSPSQPLPTIISATGLTPGNTYYLMTDGFNNDNCTFRIAANSGVNILNVNPVAPAICKGQNVNLTASGGNGTYGWAPALTLSANSGTTVTATPTTTTTYTLSSLTSGGCPLTKDVTVVVNDTPTVTVHPSTAPQNICFGGPVTALNVTATAGIGTISSYQWFITVTPSNAGGAAIPFATNATYTPSSSSIGTLYFYCRVTNSNGCSTKSNVSGAIIVRANPGTPVATATFQPTCLVPTGTIVVTSPAGANIEYSIGGAYQASGTFTGLASATYSVTARNTITGCISPIRSVTINPITPAPAAPNATATTQPTCLVPFGSIGITTPLGGNYEYSVGSIFQAGTSFSGLGINATYSVTVKDIITGCISTNTPVTINALPAGPPLPAATVTVQPTCIIPTGTILISAPSGANIQYSIGGAYQASNIFSGLTNGTSYSITATDLSTGCISDTLVIAVNTITGAPAAPTASVTSQPTCAIPTGTITISAPTGVNFEFSIGGIYQASNVFTGLTFGTSYSVTAKDIITGCVSAPLNLTINAILGSPVPTVTTPVTYCLNATASVLTATGNNLLWYTTATGGTGSSTAPTPLTTAGGSTIYYVSQTIATCESPRDERTVTINSTPAPTVTTPVTYCLNATASALTATGSNLLWYTTASGGTVSSTAPTPVTTGAGSTIYYVSQTIATCESPRASITVTINSTLAPTVTTPVTYCLNATASALTSSSSNLLWYTVATGGSGFATAPTPLTTSAGSTIYYVSQTIGTCEGPRAAITVTINSIPAPTVTTPVTYCLNATAATLTATGSNLLWYTLASGGTGSSTSPTPLTTTASSTIYYVSQTIGTCEGPRAAITVTINVTPALPTITTPVTYCINATPSALTATGSNLLWYTVATGGTGTLTAPTPVTTAAGSTIYYVSQTIATCEGPRAAITVTINSTPAPTITTPVSYCQNVTPSALTATGSNLLWYTAANGGTGSSTAPTPVTTGAGSTIYYVSQNIATCEGPRAAITVTVNPTPALPTVTTPVVYCQNATSSSLTATGSNLLWYTLATGGTGSATAPIPLTNVAGAFKYFVSQTLLGCEGPRDTINITVHPTPALPTVSTPVVYCRNATAAALSATGSSLLWYTVATGGTGSAIAPTPLTNVAGAFTYHVSQTLLGCEGPRETINITINPTPALPTVTTPVFYCQNNTAAALNAVGTNLLWYSTNSGGTGASASPIPATLSTGNTFYFVSQTNSFGCESPRNAITVTVNPTVNSVTNFSYNPNTVCKNGINPGPVYAIGFTQGGLFSSSPGLSINAVNGNIDLAGSIAGNYTVKYIYNRQGCTLADSSTNTILINPAIATNTIFSYSSPICKNDPNPIPAFANGFTTGGQFASTTGLNVDALTGRVNLATSNPGIYQVTYTLPTLGCRQGTSNFSFISITANTLPVTSFSYSPAAVCPGDANPVLSRVPGFTTGGSFKVTPAGLTMNAATGAIDVSNSTIGVYTITYSVPSLGCRFADSSRFTFIIRSATPPNINFFYTTPVCKSDPLAMPLFGTNFTAGGVFSAPAGVSINSSNGYVNVPQSTAGVYQIKYKLTATACSLADSSTTGLEIISLPSTPVISSIPVCGAGITTLSATSNGSILWYSDAATNNLVNAGSSFTTNLTRNTRYYLTSTIGNCTSLPNPIDIVINPLPAKPNLGNDTSICNGDVLVLNAGNYFGYLWQNGSTQQTFSVNASGTYSVQVSNAAGCKSADSITINILTNCDDIQFANAFSPNGDGNNEFFGPIGNLFLVNNYSLSIFNRYGELVFKSDNPNQKWDGTIKGKAYGNTSFVWVATYVYRGKIKKTQKGNVSLLR
jgi:gliding motility-associated-like protein